MSDEHGRDEGFLSDGARFIVDEESALSIKVARRLARTLVEETDTKGVTKVDTKSELLSLRDQVAEARLEDVPALVTEMMRVAAVAEVDAPDKAARVDPSNPYFGHMRLKESFQERSSLKQKSTVRDVLIGKRALVDREAGIVIVDWRNAPVSRLYYRYDEGDEYEEEFGDEVRMGEVHVRRTLSFQGGRLVRIKSPDHMLLRIDSDEPHPRWVEVAAGEAPELKGGAGKAERLPAAKRLGHTGPAHLRPDKHLPEIAALIDPAQFEAMTERDGGVVVLQGGAGSGKTTVALHRIAYLTFKDRARFRPSHIMVVVQQPALVRYVSQVLPSLDVGDVRVSSYRDWAESMIRHIVPGFRRDIVDEAPADVAQLKKHPVMLAAVRAQTEQRRGEAKLSLETALVDRPGGEAILARIRAFDDGEPLLPWLRAIGAAIDDSDVPSDTAERARRALLKTTNRAKDLLAEWEELITDRALLAPILDDDLYGMDIAAFESALRWTASQIEEPYDDEIDPEAKVPIDGGTDDEGPGYRFDPHDLAILLSMWIARTGGLVNPRTNKTIQYDHVAVDEAQDFSAVELFPLLTATGDRRSLTLAGDVVQKVVFDNAFSSWEELLTQLGTEGRAVEPFRLSYRSTAEVTEFAQEVLGPLAPAVRPTAVRNGAPVALFAFREQGEEVAFLADALRSVMGREPNANIAVLTRYPERAAFYAEMLKDAEVPFLRHVRAGEFSFSPGVDVTHIAQVKGLEYDYVVLADVSEAAFPDQAAARHLLHIGATRAAHQLWVTTSAHKPSPLLPRRLVEEALKSS
jgi:DNA helicase-2/ATP-dependent DNA helicase PcrA